MIKLKRSLQVIQICFVIASLTIIGCKKSNDKVDPNNPDTPDLTHLPFGGTAPTNILIRNQGNPQPDFLSLWLCGLPSNGAGNSDASDWTNPDGTWDYTKKPQVQGNVTWISEFNATLDGNGNRIITGNALPSHPTGIFPIQPGSIAYQYDGNPNIITEHQVLYVFPAIPEIAAEPSCVPFGPSGISLSGSAIYHGASTLGNDAAAHEILDRFGGHTDGTERYHYHFPAQDLQDHIHPHEHGQHSALMGYMLDGFGIYGPYGEDGELLTSADLDECHGHIHPVLWDGQMINLYHYHWTYDFPYNIGCFKGTPQ
ncbi:MAG: YHYH protein [Lewinellaceae bacterium]|nr:YHYH protein [Lewinellaceae bacterium]